MYMAAKTRALVVDGDARSLMFTSSILKALEIDYKRNTSGSHVPEQALEVHPDFILLNLDLPEADPFAILNAIQSNPVLRNIPVIAVGEAHIIDQLMPQLQQANFAGRLTRPFSQRDLQNLLDSLLH
jgi:CheY-like chemotaxis protein